MTDPQVVEDITDIKRRLAALERQESGLRPIYDSGELAASDQFDAQSIPQHFTNLLLLLRARSTVSANFDRVHLFFNNDTTSTNYYNRDQDAGAITNTAEIGFVSAATATAGMFGSIAVLILGYSVSSQMKQALGWQSNTPVTGNLDLGVYAFRWQGAAAAITRITMRPDGYSADKFAAGSRLQIFGMG